MLRYRPRFRHPDRAARPKNLTEAEKIAPGLTPVYGDPQELILDVETPSGEVLEVGDPALIDELSAGLEDKHILTLSRSDRAMTDCRPISLFAIQTAQQLGEEVGLDIDKRRFRANIYLDSNSAAGYGEDAFVGQSLRIGSKAVLSVLERDPRCKMITLDPDTAESNPTVMRTVAQAHEGMAGVYGAVLVEGMVRQGDAIELVG